MSQISKIIILKNSVVINTINPSSSGQKITVGRSASNVLHIDFPSISREHLTLQIKDGSIIITDLGSSYGTVINDEELIPNKEYIFSKNIDIKLAEGTYVLRVVKEVSQTAEPKTAAKKGHAASDKINALIKQYGMVTIGRDESCNWHMPSLLVSRNHATISKRNQQYFLRDLDSTNGTYVNDKKVSGEEIIGLDDMITIGSATFSLKREYIDREYAIEAENIEKKYPNGYIGLRELSIKIPKGGFVALMGPSGCGKSTLLKGLNGANPVTSGTVQIQGLKLNQSNFQFLKRSIGYVPQDDIVHRELSVNKTMFYSAKLRMSKDVSNREINKKIDEVLSALNINTKALRKNKVGELSGGQRKRVSIAVELLNDPTILFLDEPTSPLDPETIEDFLNCIKGLAKKGMTVVMVTHKPSDLEYVDKVIFLSKGGYISYYGTKDDMLGYFKKNNIIEIYSQLKTEEDGKYYNRKLREEKGAHSSLKEQVQMTKVKTNDGGLRQLYWLCRRYLNIKWNDRGNIFLLLVQPFIIAGLVSFIFPNVQIGVLFLMAISAIWFGVSNSAKEIVSETPIYERERMYNLGIWNYIFSKIIILSFIASVQVLIFISIIYYSYQDMGSDGNWAIINGFLPYAAFMFLLSLSATALGLFLSSIFNNTEKVMTVVPIILMPQIMLAGVIASLNNELKDILSWITLGRWGTEGFAHLQDNTSPRKSESDESILSVNEYNPFYDANESGQEEEFIQKEAIEALRFYKDDKMIDVFNGFELNTAMIILLGMVSLFGIRWALKRKDKFL